MTPHQIGRPPPDKGQGPEPSAPDPSHHHHEPTGADQDPGLTRSVRAGTDGFEADTSGPELTGLARRILARTPRPVPRYGSAEWLALPVDDLRRFAAVLIAAECWRDHCSAERVADDLRQAMAAEDAAVLQRIRGASRDVQLTLAATLPGWADSVSFAELAERRAS